MNNQILTEFIRYADEHDIRASDISTQFGSHNTAYLSFVLDENMISHVLAHQLLQFREQYRQQKNIEYIVYVSDQKEVRVLDFYERLKTLLLSPDEKEVLFLPITIIGYSGDNPSFENITKEKVRMIRLVPRPESNSTLFYSIVPSFFKRIDVTYYTLEEIKEEDSTRKTTCMQQDELPPVYDEYLFPPDAHESLRHIQHHFMDTWTLLDALKQKQVDCFKTNQIAADVEVEMIEGQARITIQFPLQDNFNPDVVIDLLLDTYKEYKEKSKLYYILYSHHPYIQSLSHVVAKRHQTYDSQGASFEDLLPPTVLYIQTPKAIIENPEWATVEM